jgi:hypothetical protein
MPPRVDTAFTMDGSNHALWTASDAKPENKRRHGRVKCQHIGCTLGTVVDLSASGLRIKGPGKPKVVAGDRFTMTIQTLEGPMLAPVAVAWTRKLAWRKHEIGVTFLDVGPALSKALTALARASANNEVITPWFKQGKSRHDAA